jgi:hypothetical protein
MKRILFLTALALTSIASAAPPKGNVKISVYRSEIVLVNKEYKWVTTLLCEETLPFDVQDIRTSKGANFTRSETCRFTEAGVSYQAFTYNMAYVSTYSTSGNPMHPVLGFASAIDVLDEQYKPAPFGSPAGQSILTKDLNLKNAIMVLYPNQSVTCSAESAPVAAPLLSQMPPQEDCTVQNPLGIQAVFEYDIN